MIFGWISVFSVGLLHQLIGWMRTKHKKGLQIHTSIATCIGRSEPARCGLCMCDDCRRKSNNNSTQNDDDGDGVDVDRAQEKKVRLLPNTRKD